MPGEHYSWVNTRSEWLFAAAHLATVSRTAASSKACSVVLYGRVRLVADAVEWDHLPHRQHQPAQHHQRRGSSPQWCCWSSCPAACTCSSNGWIGSELGSPQMINELSKAGDTENQIGRLVLGAAASRRGP
jgi:hypothetical protein